MHSTISGRGFRHSGSLDNDRDEMPVAVPNRGWIPMGRDFSLENTILVNLQARFDKAAANGVQCVR
jgi:hypothetical protein